MYGDSLAFGIKVHTASSTTDISWLVLCCTVLSDGVLSRLVVILALIPFHDMFLSSSCSCCLATRTGMSNMVLIMQWLEPCSVPCTAHLTMEPVRFSEARTRLIVNLWSPPCPPPCHVFVPCFSRLLRANSLIRSMIGSALPYLSKDMLLPPQSWSCWLKSPTIRASTTVPVSCLTLVIALCKLLYVSCKAWASPPST